MIDRHPEKAAVLNARSSLEGGGEASIAALVIVVLGGFFGVVAGSAWPIVVAAAVGLIIHGFVVQPQRIKKQTEKFRALCEDRSTPFREDISDPPSGLFIGVAEETGTVLMSHPISKHQVRDACLNLHDVLDIELSIDQTPVYQAGPIAALSGAALGGAVFGGAGAIVGSVAASQAGKGKVGSIALKLRLDDLETPLVRVDFIAEPIKSSSASNLLALAENWTNLIEVMRHRIGKPAHD